MISQWFFSRCHSVTIRFFLYCLILNLGFFSIFIWYCVGMDEYDERYDDWWSPWCDEDVFATFFLIHILNMKFVFMFPILFLFYKIYEFVLFWELYEGGRWWNDTILGHLLTQCEIAVYEKDFQFLILIMNLQYILRQISSNNPSFNPSDPLHSVYLHALRYQFLIEG